MDSPALAPSRSRLRRLLGFVLFVAVGVIIPAWLMEHLLDRFDAERQERLEQSAFDRATALMGQLDLGLERNRLIDEGLGRFRRRAEAVLRGQPLDAETAGVLARRAARCFPRDSTLVWFAPNARLIEPRGLPPPTTKRSWQALFRVLRRATGTTEAERTLAGNFLKATLGDIIELGYLRRAFRGSLTVLKQGKPHVIRILRFGAGPRRRQTAGWLLALLPTGRARFGWELERQVRRLSRDGAEVGGYWMSRQRGLGGELLNDNLLHGLVRRLEEGQGFSRLRDTTCLTRYWSQDPDLVLVAAVPTALLHGSLDSQRILPGLRWGLRGGAALAIGWAFLLAAGWLRLSLAAKVRLGTIFLAGFPCLAMGVWGLGHLRQVAQFQDDEVRKRLEHLLISVEQEVAATISRTQSALDRLLRSPAYFQIDTPDALREAFQDFVPIGLYEVMLGQRGRPVLSYAPHLSTDRTALRHPPHLGALLRTVIRQSGFDLGTEGDRQDAAGETVLPTSFDLAYIPRQKLHLMRLGNEAGFFFFSLVEDEQRRPLRGTLLLLDFQVFSRQAMAGWLRRRPPDRAGVFLRGLGARGISHQPRHPALRALLDLAAHTREPLCQPLELRGRRYLALARPLAGLETIGLAVLPYEAEAGFPRAARRFMLTLAGLALAVALFGADLLLFLFLRPLLGLRALIERVERGDTAVRSPRWPTDELAELALAFNDLVASLGQKERMKPFLNRDLLEQVQAMPEVRTERRRVVVFFAGLREFSRFERLVPPEETLQAMSAFLGRVEEVVRRWGGEIDKFLGDSALAVFVEDEGAHARPCGERAARAALDLQQEMAAWNAERGRRDQPALRAGVGLAGGPVIRGHVGSWRKRLDFTVIGDPVNLAARLEKLAARSGAPAILATDDVVSGTTPGLRLIPTAIQTVRGRQGTVTVVGVEPGDS